MAQTTKQQKQVKQVRIDFAKRELKLILMAKIELFESTDRKAPELTNLDVICVLSDLIKQQAE